MTTSRASNALSYLILLGGFLTILLSAYLVVVSYSSLPHWDLWDTQIDFAAKGGLQSTMHWLWKQEDQHRLVIPKLFLLADLRWFHATQVFLLASIFHNSDAAPGITGLEYAGARRLARCGLACWLWVGCFLPVLPIAMGKLRVGFSNLLRLAGNVEYALVYRSAALLDGRETISSRTILAISCALGWGSTGSYLLAIERQSALALIGSRSIVASTAGCGAELCCSRRSQRGGLSPQLHTATGHHFYPAITAHYFQVCERVLRELLGIFFWQLEFW